MFKRFTQDENVSSNSQIKSSVQRSMRAKLIEQFPLIEEVLDDILPKKGNITIAKCSNKISLICRDNKIMFFQERDGPIFPTLRLVHQYPNFMPKMQVDKGAIKFILNGSNIMCPGFTSDGGRMEESIEAGQAVCIMAEGKQHALAIGLTVMSTDEIREQNKGIGVDNMHYLGDGLWGVPDLD
eukprot:TRINITY_DN8122_c0_g1_i1.p1 TRINITY_DN8122_c0_g1~~TRINITY_DN8122_c0_g1_i1.p1  ORF type:complete len:183 (-),score=32.64 TRINITY_DN8122_c0_g1_i1:43-591(-)